MNIDVKRCDSELGRSDGLMQRGNWELAGVEEDCSAERIIVEGGMMRSGVAIRRANPKQTPAGRTSTGWS